MGQGDSKLCKYTQLTLSIETDTSEHHFASFLQPPGGVTLWCLLCLSLENNYSYMIVHVALRLQHHFAKLYFVHRFRFGSSNSVFKKAP